MTRLPRRGAVAEHLGTEHTKSPMRRGNALDVIPKLP